METRNSPSPLAAFWSRLGNRGTPLAVAGILAILIVCTLIGILLINVLPSSRSDAYAGTGTPTTAAILVVTETPTRTDVPPPTDAAIPSTTPMPTSTATATKPATATKRVPTKTPPRPTATLPPPATPHGINVRCGTQGALQLCAWVSNGRPARNATVIVYGRLYKNGKPVAGSRMNTVWVFKNARLSCSAITAVNGLASCKRTIGKVTNNYQVNVNVWLGGLVATTWFVP